MVKNTVTLGVEYLARSELAPYIITFVIGFCLGVMVTISASHPSNSFYEVVAWMKAYKVMYWSQAWVTRWVDGACNTQILVSLGGVFGASMLGMSRVAQVYRDRRAALPTRIAVKYLTNGLG